MTRNFVVKKETDHNHFAREFRVHKVGHREKKNG